MKTLVVVSHPYPEQSQSIKALQDVAEATPHVTVRNLETLYGDKLDAFNVAAEQQAADAAERIVFLFPIHWFNLTPMLKAYLNKVWSYGWAFGPGGTALKDKELVVVVTAGASEHTYSAAGAIQSSMAEVLTPMKASALYVGMKYSEPLPFYDAMGPSGESIAAMKKTFSERLKA